MNKILSNPHSLDITQFFELSESESTLVSKAVGKFSPANPRVLLTLGQCMAMKWVGCPTFDLLYDNANYMFMEEVKPVKSFWKTLFVGLTECSTVLGCSASFMLENSSYIGITTSKVKSMKTSIKLSDTPTYYLNTNILDLNSYKDIVFVTDVINSGKILCNCIRSLHNFIKDDNVRYGVMTILDNRSNSAKDKFDKLFKKLGINITVQSLFTGTYSFNYESAPINPRLIIDDVAPTHLDIFKRLIILDDPVNNKQLSGIGRFGISQEAINYLTPEAYDCALELLHFITSFDNKVLIISTDDNVYISSLVAYQLRYLGIQADVQTTTTYAYKLDGVSLKNSIYFKYNGNHFLYNYENLDKYDQVISLVDRIPIPRLCNNYDSFML